MPAQPSFQLAEDGLVGVDAGAARNTDQPSRQPDHTLVVRARLFKRIRLVLKCRQGHRSTGRASMAVSVSSFAEPAYSCLACSTSARAWSGCASRMPVSKLDAAVRLGIVTTAWDSEATKNRSGSRT